MESMSGVFKSIKIRALPAGIEEATWVQTSSSISLFNPFISITPSKPLMSSGSWLTLHYCDIYYLSAVNYDPVTTDIIFIRVSIYPGTGKGGLQLILKPIYLPCNLPPQYWQRSLFTQGGWGRVFSGNFPTHLFLSGSLFTLRHQPTILAEVTINPARFTALFWLVSRPLFTLGL